MNEPKMRRKLEHVALDTKVRAGELCNQGCGWTQKRQEFLIP